MIDAIRKAGVLAALILMGCSTGSKVPYSYDMPELHKAARDGNAAMVSALLNAGGEVNARDKRNNTPLVYAAGRGKADMVQMLLESGADVDRGGISSPLHSAAFWAHVDAVEVLLKAGADVHARGASARTPLHDVVVYWRYDSDWVRPPVLQAQTIVALVEAGANVESRDKFGYTPLHLAALNGYPGALKSLIDAGAKVNALNQRWNITALGLALEHGKSRYPGGRSQVIEILKAHGGR